MRFSCGEDNARHVFVPFSHLQLFKVQNDPSILKCHTELRPEQLNVLTLASVY